MVEYQLVTSRTMLQGARDRPPARPPACPPTRLRGAVMEFVTGDVAPAVQQTELNLLLATRWPVTAPGPRNSHHLMPRSDGRPRVGRARHASTDLRGRAAASRRTGVVSRQQRHHRGQNHRAPPTDRQTLCGTAANTIHSETVWLVRRGTVRYCPPRLTKYSPSADIALS